MTRLLNQNLLRGISLCLLFFIASCKPDEPVQYVRDTRYYDKTAAYEWHKLMLEISRYTPNWRPPMQARALAYISLAGYEAAVPGMPQYNSLRSHYPALRLPTAIPGLKYHYPTAVHVAYGTIIKAFYKNLPADLVTKVNALDTRLREAYKTHIPKDIFDRSVSFGTQIAEGMYAWSATDTEGHDAYLRAQPTDYVPPTGRGKWQPTFPDFSRALTPYWGRVRPFAIKSTDRLAVAPIPYSTNRNSEFYKQAYEVYEQSKTKLTYQGRWIAEFWSDDIFGLTMEPTTRMISLTNQILELKNANLETAVVSYAKVSLSLCDAGIATWFSKYVYNLERPVSYIRREIDPTYITILNNPLTNTKGLTPPFPAYTSGHSAFAAAWAGALASVYGDNVAFVDRTHQGRTEFISTPRGFASLSACAKENALSRIPLGVHYRMDCDEGLRLGYLAARKVNELNWVKR